MLTLGLGFCHFHSGTLGRHLPGTGHYDIGSVALNFSLAHASGARTAQGVAHERDPAEPGGHVFAKLVHSRAGASGGFGE